MAISVLGIKVRHAKHHAVSSPLLTATVAISGSHNIVRIIIEQHLIWKKKKKKHISLPQIDVEM